MLCYVMLGTVMDGAVGTCVKLFLFFNFFNLERKLSHLIHRHLSSMLKTNNSMITCTELWPKKKQRYFSSAIEVKPRVMF